MYGYAGQQPQYGQPPQQGQYMQPQQPGHYMQPGIQSYQQQQPSMMPGYNSMNGGMMMTTSSSSSMASSVAMNAGMTRPPPNFSPYSPGYSPSNPTAFALFSAVDTNRSGTVDVKELHTALTNGGWTKFSPKTTRLLMKMFDVDRSEPAGTLQYMEFERLLNQLNQWRQYFDNADKDRSGKLNMTEVSASVRSFGFNLPDPILKMVFLAYDEDASGAVAFDEYVQLLAELNALTTMFRRYDTHGTGTATIDYHTFMTIIYATRA